MEIRHPGFAHLCQPQFASPEAFPLRKSSNVTPSSSIATGNSGSAKGTDNRIRRRAFTYDSISRFSSQGCSSQLTPRRMHRQADLLPLREIDAPYGNVQAQRSKHHASSNESFFRRSRLSEHRMSAAKPKQNATVRPFSCRSAWTSALPEKKKYPSTAYFQLTQAAKGKQKDKWRERSANGTDGCVTLCTRLGNNRAAKHLA